MKSSARRNKVRLLRLRNSSAVAFRRCVLPKPKPPWVYSSVYVALAGLRPEGARRAMAEFVVGTRN